MGSDKLHDWLQIVGAAAIVASLIFVGMQLKQSQDIAIANQYQARFESAAETARAYIQSDTALKAWGSFLTDKIQSDGSISDEFRAWAQGQSPEEIAFRYWSAYIELKTHDNHLFQYEQGFMEVESWLAFRETFKMMLSAPKELYVVRQIYLDNPGIWRRSFGKYVEELLSEIQTERADSQY